MTQALTREWYTELEKQSNSNFINLPIEFQIRDYSYSTISSSYHSFFKNPDSTRHDKLKLAQKFLKFVRSINKNRAKEECNEDFFKAFSYFMDNFSDLLSKQDNIHLETLSLLTEAVDKSQFIEDVLSVDDLKRRITNLKNTQEKEDAIDAEWSSFESEYKQVQALPEGHTPNPEPEEQNALL